jgi:enoyl-CoA hydratase
MSDAVSYEDRGDVAVVRLDDGKANALSPAVLAAINSALDQAQEAKQAVLLTGRPGRFSAGFDLGVMREGGPDAAVAMVCAGAELAIRIARFPAPTIIACTGHALAMGAVLLTAADTRIGSEGDFKIGFNEVAINMTTPIFLLELARERISKRHFFRAVVQAEIYEPASAVDAGFFDAVAPAEQVFDQALAKAFALAKLPRGPYVRTRALARSATLELIESNLKENVAGGFGGQG